MVCKARLSCGSGHLGVVAFQHGAGDPAGEVGAEDEPQEHGFSQLHVDPGASFKAVQPETKSATRMKLLLEKIRCEKISVSRTEVTQAAFQRVMEFNPSIFEGRYL